MIQGVATNIVLKSFVPSSGSPICWKKKNTLLAKARQQASQEDLAGDIVYAWYRINLGEKNFHRFAGPAGYGAGTAGAAELAGSPVPTWDIHYRNCLKANASGEPGFVARTGHHEPTCLLPASHLLGCHILLLSAGRWHADRLES